MPAALDTAQLLLDIDQTINHRLDGLLVQLHLHAFDACSTARSHACVQKAFYVESRVAASA